MTDDLLARVLNNTHPLPQGLKTSHPLYIWQVMDPPLATERHRREIVEELHARGIGLPVVWDPKHRRQSLQTGLAYGKLQQQLGLPVPVNADACVHGFFDGSRERAHIGASGELFFDDSIPGPRKIGCPFTLEDRIDPVREQIEFFLDAYLAEGVHPTFVFADWEIDGPLEINGAHAHALRCHRCRSQIGDIEEFRVFRDVLRKIRCDLTRSCYAEPVRNRFPTARVGNYGVYHHDGYRYWYDWFEEVNTAHPSRREQGAVYREWFQEFPLTGYTVGMPVVYPRARIHEWFDFEDQDYRWFYGMMKGVVNAGRHRPRGVPNVSFVHWHTTDAARTASDELPQMSSNAYQELLRHMMLRGTDGLFMWCRPGETDQELPLVHEVFSEMQPLASWVDNGSPLVFSTPERPGEVFSASRLGGCILARRTSFGPAEDRLPEELIAAEVTSEIPDGTWTQIQT